MQQWKRKNKKPVTKNSVNKERKQQRKNELMDDLEKGNRREKEAMTKGRKKTKKRDRRMKGRKKDCIKQGTNGCKKKKKKEM